MKFKTFELSNYERWEHLILPFSLCGLIGITGKTGHGKSSIFNGLSWCLFGVSLKGQRGDDVVRRTIGKDCFGKIEIEDDPGIYVIERYRKHKVYKNNLYFKLLPSDGSKEIDLSGWNNDSTQINIEKYLGMDVNLFTNSIIFAQGFSKFFVSLGDTEQKELIEGFIDSLVWQQALEVVKQDLKDTEIELDTVNSDKILTDHKIKNLRNDLEVYQSECDNFEENRSKTIGELKANLADAVLKIQQLDTELKDMQKESQELNLKIIALKVQAALSICDSCGQNLPFVDSDILMEYQNRNYDLNIKQPNIELRLKYTKEKKESILYEIVKEKSNENAYGKTIVSIKSKLSVIETERKNLIESVELLEQKIIDIEFWNKGFGNQGIPNFLFESVIPAINKYLKYYSDLISGGTIQISLKPNKQLKSGEKREKFSIIIQNEEGGNTYADASAGEKRIVNLSFVFAIQDVARERLKQAIPLEVMDEAMDALDADYAEIVFDILKEHSKNRAVFVVTHADNLKALFDKEYRVFKQKGISKLLEV